MNNEAGWYPDPVHTEQERYWDGRMWTQYDRPLGSQDPGPLAFVPAADGTFALHGQPSAPALGGITASKRPRRRGLVVGIAAGALVLGALAGLGVSQLGGSGSPASASEAVTTAAAQSLGANSADMTMSMNISGMGQSEQISGNGAFDFTAKTAKFSVNIPVGSQTKTEQVIEDGGTIYVNLGDLVGQVAPGKSWVSADAGRFSGSGGALSGGMSAWDDPSSILQQLQASGATVTSDGPTTYDGTAVDEYSVTLPTSALTKALGALPASVQQYANSLSLPPITAKVYIESDNHLLRAMDMPVSFSILGQSLSMDMQMAFSNYGTPVSVTPPPADQVIPLSQFQGLGGFGGDAGGTGTGTGSLGNTGNSGGLLPTS